MFTLLNLIIAVLGILVLVAGIVPSLKNEIPVFNKVVQNKSLIKNAAIFFISLQLLIGMFQMRKLMSIGMDDFEMLFYLLAMFSVLVVTFVVGKDMFLKLNNSAKD